MPKSMSVVCSELAQLARSADHETLAYILRMAASEARSVNAESRDEMDIFAGTWDWDVGNDLNYVDPTGAQLFGVDILDAARGLPNATYIKAIHPDDTANLNAALGRSLKAGGPFEQEYRVIAGNQIRWVLAKGHATTDRSGRLLRFPGVMFDMTKQKALREPHFEDLN